MKKTIYYWSPHLTNVGTVRSTLNSAASFSKFTKNKFDVKIIDVFGEWEEYSEILKKSNIKKINLTFNYKKILPKYGFVFSRLSYIIIILVSLIPLLILLVRKKPDYFIIHLLTSLPLLLFKIFKFHSKIILRISGKPKLNIFRRILWKLVNNIIFKITCPTNELVDKLNISKIFSSNKIFYLMDPVIDIKDYLQKKNLRPECYKFDKEPFLLSVGRFTRQKNYTYLINEYEQFLKSYDKLNLIIIGDGEEKKKIEKLILKKNLQNKIYLAGYENNFYFFMNNASAFILPSLWEELGLAIVQAAMSNTVIISSDCPNGPKEFLNNGQSGILFRNNYEGALCNSLVYFVKNENLLKTKRIIAKKNVLNYTKFRHHKTFCKILNI
jgi:glycosyltransferase involved in cell wall biosynthesis